MKKIGVFGPGLGALTITAQLKRAKACAELVHVADLTFNPYGNRPPRQVSSLVANAMRFLSARGCEVVVLGCNTSSTQAESALEQLTLEERPAQVVNILQVTVCGLERLAPNSHILILATVATVESQFYQRELAQRYPGMRVNVCALPQLAGLIDNGAAADTIQRYLDREIESHADALQEVQQVVLCCTHFPLVAKLIENSIERISGRSLNCLGQSAFVIEELNKRFPACDVTAEPPPEIWISARNDIFEQIVQQEIGNFEMNLLKDWNLAEESQ